MLSGYSSRWSLRIVRGSLEMRAVDVSVLPFPKFWSRQQHSFSSPTRLHILVLQIHNCNCRRKPESKVNNIPFTSLIYSTTEELWKWVAANGSPSENHGLTVWERKMVKVHNTASFATWTPVGRISHALEIFLNASYYCWKKSNFFPESYKL